MKIAADAVQRNTGEQGSECYLTFPFISGIDPVFSIHHRSVRVFRLQLGIQILQVVIGEHFTIFLRVQRGIGNRYQYLFPCSRGGFCPPASVKFRPHIGIKLPESVIVEVQYVNVSFDCLVCLECQFGFFLSVIPLSPGSFRCSRCARIKDRQQKQGYGQNGRNIVDGQVKGDNIMNMQPVFFYVIFHFHELQLLSFPAANILGCFLKNHHFMRLKCRFLRFLNFKICFKCLFPIAIL